MDITNQQLENVKAEEGLMHTKKAYSQWIQDFSYADAINGYNYFCSLLDDSYPTGV